MTDLSLPRETGSEKSDLQCQICGGLVPAVTSAYGSISPGACPVCWPAAAPSQLAAQQAAADEAPPEQDHPGGTFTEITSDPVDALQPPD